MQLHGYARTSRSGGWLSPMALGFAIGCIPVLLRRVPAIAQAESGN
jgi:hypothetical protein